MTRLSAGESRARLAEFWDKSRRYYEQAEAVNLQASPERRLLLSYLQGSERLLDLGCGSCENAGWIPPSCRYVGLDLSTAALLMARQKGRYGWRLRGDAQSLPLATESLEAVLSTYALEHLHDPGATFVEVARVLRPQGLLLLVGSAWDLPYDLPPSLAPRRRLGVTLRRLWRQLAGSLAGEHTFDLVREPRVLREGYVPDSDAVYVVQSARLVAFLEAVGFEVLEHRTLPHRPDPPGPRRRLRQVLRHLPLWSHGWGNTLVVARRGPMYHRPPWRLLYL